MRGHSTIVQQPLFPVSSVWTPTPVSQLPSWECAKRVGLDCETCDPQLKALGPGPRRGGFVAGISFQIEDGPGYYLPIRHAGGGNLPEDAVWQYLRDQAKVFKGAICGLNLSYDLDYLATCGGVWFQRAAFLDAGVADPLIDDQHRSYSLNAVAKRHGLPLKKETMLRLAANSQGLNPKSDMWQLHAQYVAEYAVYDAALPLQLLRKQERLLEAADLMGVWKLESDLLPVLVQMRMRGVAVDLNRLDRLEQQYLAEETQACAVIKRESGASIAPDELDNAAAIAGVLRALGYSEKDLGLTKGRTNKKTGEVKGRQLKTDAATLKKIKHPAIKALRRAKRFHKLRCTFVASIRRYQTNGRIHCTFRQVKSATDFGDDEKGANYGRTSCTDPNMQQQPNPERDPEIAGEFRRVYVPDEGKLWACCDYSQQEVRMLVHFAERLGLAYEARNRRPEWLDKATQAATTYRTNPDVDNHSMMAEMCGRPCPLCGGSGCKGCNDCGYDRKGAKVILLGKMYGMGGGKLCKSLGLPTVIKTFESDWGKMKAGDTYLAAGPEGQEIIEQFDERLPFVKALYDECRIRASRRGFIRTLAGRNCRFPLDEDGRYDFTHKALNRLIQGSSGDQMKKAVVDMAKAGFEPQLIVHDEVDLSVNSREEAEEIGRIMSEAYQLRVPFKVDVEVGKTWGDVE